ncbi:MAG: SsrA-binding protein SmpB [candidate division WWE3 bacterium]|nr:SsrA-binding protein SmpB [candidate division WWE3 bacterium]
MILAENRMARHDYEILETWEAGIALLGSEVKSVRGKNARLNGAYVKFFNAQPYLVGAHIQNYKNSAIMFDPERSRQLLLTKSEVKRMVGLGGRKGYALIPLQFYTLGDRIKLTVGLGHGRNQYGKKELVKSRDIERETDRELKEIDTGNQRPAE